MRLGDLVDQLVRLGDELGPETEVCVQMDGECDPLCEVSVTYGTVFLGNH